jgi:hypothetical protein
MGGGEVPPPGSELWFVKPDLDEHLRFRSVPTTPIDWDASCAAHPFFEHTDLESLARDSLGFEPADYFASPSLPMQFTQFWREGNEFRQLSFVWEQNTPQTFSVDVFASPSATMSSDVRRIELEGLPGSGQGQLYSGIQAFLRKDLPAMLQASNRRMGARVALFRASARGVSPQEPVFYFAELRNAQIVNVSGGSLNCGLSSARSKAFCACSSVSR